MEDVTIEPVARKLSDKERIEREYENELRDLKIGRMRAVVVRSQVTEAYKILESIRFDFVSDTMFRDYATRAKQNLEGMISDFLLSDNKWEEWIDNHRGLSAKEYQEKITQDEQTPNRK